MAVDEVAPRQFLLAVAGLFALLALALFWPTVPLHTNVIDGCGCADQVQQAWFLNYFPWALLHGHNPFYTSAFDIPRGVNLAANTTMPLLGLLLSPVSLLWNGIVAYNVGIWLAFASSAWSACYVARRWFGSNLVGLLVGLVYGFGPYMIHQGYDHLNLVFNPIPPLLFFVAHRLLSADRATQRDGILLGLLAAAQYLISAEILLSSALFIAFAAAFSGARHWRVITRARVATLLRALGGGVAVALVITAYPLYYQFFGRNPILGASTDGLSNPFHANPIGFMLPTVLELFSTKHLTTITNLVANPPENGTYLGVPLALLFLVCWIKEWRRPLVRLTGALAVTAWILSLGPDLIVQGHPIHLPFYYLSALPEIVNILPVRLSLYLDFFVALTVGQVIVTWLQTLRHHNETTTTGTTHPLRAALSVVVLVSVVALIPVVPLPTWNLSTLAPPFFRDGASTALAPNALVMTYPVAYEYDISPTYWQLLDGLRWRLTGGYALIPSPYPNGFSRSPWPTTPGDVPTYLLYDESYPGFAAKATPPPVADLRRYVRHYRIDAVVVNNSTPGASQVDAWLTRAFGRPSVLGGADLWNHLTRQ